jgi:hypothetical protein
MAYYVMEYLDPSLTPIGYAFMAETDYTKWQKDPQRGEMYVYAVIGGNEMSAEWGTVPRSRLWDYKTTVPELPNNCGDIDEWLSRNAGRS